jgi:hypothetical protein
MKYLRVEEDATYIYVYADGWYHRITKLIQTDDTFFLSYTNDETQRGAAYYWLMSSSQLYYFGYARESITILENLPDRVIILVTGGFSSSASDGDPLQDDSDTTDITTKVWLTFYKDRVEIDTRIIVAAGEEVSLQIGRLNGLAYYGINTSNPTSHYESADSEVEKLSDGWENSADYICMLDDNTRVQLLYREAYILGTSTMQQYIDQFNDRYFLCPVGGVLTAGETRINNTFIFDTDQNEGSAFLYDATDRVAIGNDCKDLILYAENYQDFTVEGAGSSFDIFQTKINIDSIAEDSTDNIYKDYGVNYFNGDFRHRLKFRFNSDDEWKNSIPGLWAISNTAGFDYSDLSTTTLCVYGNPSSGSTRWVLYIEKTGSYDTVADTGGALILSDTDYWLIIKRISGTVYLELYSDPKCNNLMEASSGISFSTQCRYLNAFFTNWSSGDTFSHQVGNLSLDPDNQPDKGFFVFDSNVPKTIGEGLAIDGAWQVEGDDGETELVMDRTRIRTSFVVDSSLFHSGSIESPTDHLLAHWKMDETGAIYTLDNAQGNAALDLTLNSGTGRDASDLTTVDCKQGSALYFLDASDDHARVALSSPTWHTDFTIITEIKPEWAYNSGTETIWRLPYDGDNFIQLTYLNTGIWRLAVELNNVSLTWDLNTAYTSNEQMQRWFTIGISFNQAMDTIVAWIDSDILYKTKTDNWAAAPTELWVGSYNATTDNITGKIDNVKLISPGVVPFGAHFVGNGVIDAAVAHKTILFHWNCSGVTAADYLGDSAPILAGGGEAYVTGIYGNGLECKDTGEYAYIKSANNINPAQGSISFWFKSNAAFSDGQAHMLFGISGAGDSPDDLVILKWTNNYLYFEIGEEDETVVWSNYTTSSIIDDNWTSWNHYRFTWDSAGLSAPQRMSVYKNRILVQPNAVISAPWIPGAIATNLGIGNDYGNTARDMDGVMDELYITDDPGTPEIWTAGGTPMHNLLTDVS